MKYSIQGTLLPALTIELTNKDTIYGQSGAMCWKSPNIEMVTTARGGLWTGFKRLISGESFFLTTFRCTTGTGIVSFSSSSPGRIVDIDLNPKQEYICQKDAFLCAQEGVILGIHVKAKLGRGFFGGEGFVLQKLSGKGKAFLGIDGELFSYKLEKGEVLQVDTGHIAFYDASVDYDIQRVQGISNIIFGKEGIFLATLKGPGTVYLQSLPLKKLRKHLSKQSTAIDTTGGIW